MCKQTQGFRQKICVQLGIADNGLPEKVKGRRTLFGVLMMATKIVCCYSTCLPFYISFGLLVQIKYFRQRSDRLLPRITLKFLLPISFLKKIVHRYFVKAKGKIEELRICTLIYLFFLSFGGHFVSSKTRSACSRFGGNHRKKKAKANVFTGKSLPISPG